jgi:hypothetical protein
MTILHSTKPGLRHSETASPAESASPGISAFRVALFFFYVAGFAIVIGGLYAGRSLYLTPLAERAHSEGYWRFKPGGTVGLPLGIAGTAMMTLLLLYSARKRVPALRGLGPLSRWLDVHIFLGIIGPLLVMLHSSFKVHGLVALSFWSMVAVASSGVLGRYLYLQIPRTRAGDELTLAELVAQDTALTERLRREFGLDDDHLRRLDALATPPPRSGLLRTLSVMMVAEMSLGRRLRAFGRESGAPLSLDRPLMRVIAQKAQLRRRIVFWDALHQLFHHWHVIHKPFAIVMYLFMVVHAVVASMTGYGWAW